MHNEKQKEVNSSEEPIKKTLRNFLEFIPWDENLVIYEPCKNNPYGYTKLMECSRDCVADKYLDRIVGAVRGDYLRIKIFITAIAAKDGYMR